eukprot:scpid23685/ scgid29575/ 
MNDVEAAATILRTESKPESLLENLTVLQLSTLMKYLGGTSGSRFNKAEKITQVTKLLHHPGVSYLHLCHLYYSTALTQFAQLVSSHYMHCNLHHGRLRFDMKRWLVHYLLALGALLVFLIVKGRSRAARPRLLGMTWV